MDIETNNTDWSVTELEAAVDAYLKMLELEKIGQKFNKAQENRTLRAGALAGRTESSIEFRMLNISTVLERMGKKRINGYKPAPHVGSNVENSIRDVLAGRGILAGDECIPTADDETLERRAIALQKQKIKEPPKGILKPKRAPSLGKVYVRDPEVRAWVRNEAEGQCEACDEPAPFQKLGLPYLEVHHVRPLAEKGSDRITNAIALCPNCHQRCHHSNDRHDYTESLYSKIGRLIRE
ncbi:5-methylcytosine-specific restriction protein A [Pseudomonas sp. BT76 TE3572]|uniref:HNH endonuclease n=1 Tax=Pseudomonas sp. BT76 TE3572 TaxID=3349325 RepID=UPI003D23CCC5